MKIDEPDCLISYNSQTILTQRKVYIHEVKNSGECIQLGIVCQNKQDLDSALMYFEKAILLSPDSFEPYFHKGHLHHSKKEYVQAIDAYEKALELANEKIEIYGNLITSYIGIAEYQKAIFYAEKGLIINPYSIFLLTQLSTCLINLSRDSEGEEYIEKILRVDPLCSQALFLSGMVLKRRGNFNDAIERLSSTLKNDPDHYEALLARAECYCQEHSFDLAIHDYQNAAIAAFKLTHLIPDLQYLPLWNMSLILLRMGNYVKGWDLYEHRFNVQQIGNKKLYDDASLLQTIDIQAGDVVVYAEQGFGDVIQFCRYLLLFKDRCSKITFVVPECIAELMQTLSQDIVVTHLIPHLEKSTLQTPLLSLPRLFKTQLATIPRCGSYLHATPHFMHKWGNRLGAKKYIRIGVVYRSGTKSSGGKSRDIPLKIFSHLFDFTFEFHLLHNESFAEDEPILSSFPNVISHEKYIYTFSDTAALISHMDLVISADTGPAHLAAALGKPTWILLQKTPDFRWMLDRTDSLWYPSVTLFRQQQNGNWPAVIDRVKAELKKFS